MEELRKKTINRWKESGLLDGLVGGVPEELGQLFECEKQHWIFENSSPPIHCMPETFRVIE